MTGRLFRRWQFRHQEVQEDRQLLPLGIGVRQDRRQEAVGADKDLGLALEVDLAILVERLVVGGDASVENWVETVSIGVAKVELDELINLGFVVDLIGIQLGLQVVQLVRVGLLAENGRSVVRGEGTIP